MEHSAYGMRIALPVPFETAVAQASDALKAEGFGVLTSIDVRQTLKTKLNRDFRPYVILGACNPMLADRALHAELEIGLLLPCNVIVYEVRDRAVRLLNPKKRIRLMTSVIGAGCPSCTRQETLGRTALPGPFRSARTLQTHSPGVGDHLERREQGSLQCSRMHF
jgi:uncharacterized protein (DUF302 family)